MRAELRECIAPVARTCVEAARASSLADARISIRSTSPARSASFAERPHEAAHGSTFGEPPATIFDTLRTFA